MKKYIPILDGKEGIYSIFAIYHMLDFWTSEKIVLEGNMTVYCVSHIIPITRFSLSQDT